LIEDGSGPCAQTERPGPPEPAEALPGGTLRGLLSPDYCWRSVPKLMANQWT